MATLRSIKKDVDYLISAVVSDCYTCMLIGHKSKDEVLKIVEDAIEARNNFIQQANNPADKKNKSLVKKHYAFLNKEIMTTVDSLFERLSALCKQ